MAGAKKREGGDAIEQAARTLGAEGASEGGKARAARLTPKERSKIARAGGKARQRQRKHEPEAPSVKRRKGKA